MPNLTAIEILLTALIFLGGSLVFSTVGFGIGVSTIPLLLILFDPQTVVLVVNTVSLGLFVLVIYQTRESLRVREIAPIVAAGLLGVPVGVYFLSAADISLLRISIAGGILIFTGIASVNFRSILPKSPVTGIVVGFVVSVLLVGLGVGGALIALFALTRDWERHAVRGSLALYFLVIEGTAVLGYGFAGMFTPERVSLIAVAAIPVAVGFAIAARIHRRMNERIFRRALLFMIIASSLVVLAREAAALAG